LLTGKTIGKTTGKSCRVSDGGGKFTPPAARGVMEKSLISLWFPGGPALASRSTGNGYQPASPAVSMRIKE
jgi:hypothetical protein